jgi:hypothetical protein
LAFDLLNEYGNSPTLTRGGQYFKLTELMIGLASGDVIERACRWYVSKLRSEGFPTMAEFRRLRKLGVIELPRLASLRANRAFQICLANAFDQYESQAQRRQNRRRSAAA